MDRLTIWFNGSAYFVKDIDGNEIARKLAEYEDLEENGMILPVKPGTIVCAVEKESNSLFADCDAISPFDHYEVKKRKFQIEDIHYFGLTVFDNEDDAEEICKMKNNAFDVLNKVNNALSFLDTEVFQ